MKSETLPSFPNSRGKLKDFFSRRQRVCVAAFLLLALTALFSLQPTARGRSLQITQPSTPDPDPDPDFKDQKLHILLPTTNGDVNLCKTVLSGRAAGYPNPVLIGWNDTHKTSYLLGGGSHIAKVSKVLEWLRAQEPAADGDLVLMMDAFDVWMQLRPETLVRRYRAINAAADARIAAQMGKAAEIEGIRQTIVFGAGKRCAPNQSHKIACYAVPRSPIPDDVYGANTDTVVGRNRWASNKQRYLNSGYVIGPVGDMRRLFEKAWEKVQSWPTYDPDDNGSTSTDFMYHGSDQATFAAMFGEQEFQREVMRRRHSGWTDKAKNWKLSGGRPNTIEGTVIGDDILDPPFTHQTMEPLEGKPCEFGIGLDYFSDLGHQTANAEYDGKWLRYSDPLEKIYNQTESGRNKFDCRYRGEGKLPADVARSAAPSPAGAWDQVDLFTNLCLDRVPVMVHHNGDKNAREKMWTKLWSQPHAKEAVEKSRERKDGRDELGALAYGHGFIGWDELCPPSYEEELFKKPGQKVAAVGKETSGEEKGDEQSQGEKEDEQSPGEKEDEQSQGEKEDEQSQGKQESEQSRGKQESEQSQGRSQGRKADEGHGHEHKHDHKMDHVHEGVHGHEEDH